VKPLKPTLAKAKVVRKRENSWGGPENGNAGATIITGGGFDYRVMLMLFGFTTVASPPAQQETENWEDE
jgi:hypothetical protein